jgi:DNA-binding PadR family transcriptional regulator
LPGTLEMMILKTLSRGPNHGHGIAQHIQGVSAGRAQDRGGIALPALQRLLVNDWVHAEWGVSKATARRVSTNSRRPAASALAEERRTFDARSRRSAA